MNVIYFFIVLFIVNIAMYLIMVQASKLNRKNSQFIQGIIIIIAALLFTILDALIYSGMIGWNKESFHFQVSQNANNVWLKVFALRVKMVNVNHLIIQIKILLIFPPKSRVTTKKVSMDVIDGPTAGMVISL